MKICIILRDPYPVGMACSNRIHLYARGLIEQGHEVKVLVPLPLERPGQVRNPDRKGTFDGVPYECAWNTTVRSRSFFGRRLHDLFAPLYAALQCVKTRENVFLMVSNSAYLIGLFRLVAWAIGAKYIQEKSEIPFFCQERLSLWQRLYVRYVYKLFDGIVVISDSLWSYFEPKIRKKASLFKVPILVDVDRVYDPAAPRDKTIVYTGPLTQHKDGILTILESFSKIADDFRDYTLEMTGNLSESPVQQEIKGLVDKYQLQDRIRFLGFVDRETLLVVLNRAGVLVLAKPLNRQTSACFPTKLGEYLATGNPVLVTGVGEIPQYLKDGITAFLSETTVEAFAERLHDVLSDPDKARDVGRRGQELARRYFDCGLQTRRLGKFLEEISCGER